MKTVLFLLFVVAVVGCSYDDNELVDNYIVDNHRILSVKVDKPLASPGDTVKMNLLIGGKKFLQSSGVDIQWQVGNYSMMQSYKKTADEDLALTFEIPMENQAGNESFEKIISSSDLSVYTSAKEVALEAVVSYDNLEAIKHFIVASKEATKVHKNPVIEKLSYKTNAGEATVLKGGTVTIAAATSPYIALSPVITEGTLPASVSYNWYVNLSDDNQKIVVDSSQASALASGKSVGYDKENVIFKVAKGSFQVYFVVKDSAVNQYGEDYFYFNLVVQ